MVNCYGVVCLHFDEDEEDDPPMCGITICSSCWRELDPDEAVGPAEPGPPELFG